MGCGLWGEDREGKGKKTGRGKDALGGNFCFFYLFFFKKKVLCFEKRKEKKRKEFLDACECECEGEGRKKIWHLG